MSRAPLIRLALLVLAVAGTACASTGEGASPRGTSLAGGGDCPVAPVPVAVSVDQWGDLVGRLGGSCATVTTILASSAADPHEFEPSPADIAAIGDAQLVVVNGLGYDAWAATAAEQADPAPVLVDAGRASDAPGDGNPHLWYSPAAVGAVMSTVTAELRDLLPGAEAYLEERARAVRSDLRPYTDLIDSLSQRHRDRTFAATEPVFDLMGDALGLANGTPPGYAAAAANGSDPSPADLAAFDTALRSGAIDVLVVNTQTESELTARLRGAAEGARVPVVEVTETVPQGSSFAAWQADQLRRLDTALSAAG